MKNTKNFFGIRKSELGMAFHTALRKGCDSPTSSLLWALINLNASNHAWEVFLEAIWSHRTEVTAKYFKASILKILEREKFKEHDSLVNVLYLAFKCLTDDDWEGIKSFLHVS